MTARRARAAAAAAAFSLALAALSGAAAQTTRPGPGAPAPPPPPSAVAPAASQPVLLSLPGADSPFGSVTVDREAADGSYGIEVRADRVEDGRRIVVAKRRPANPLNPTVVTARAVPGAVFVGWNDDAGCPATTLPLPNRWPSGFAPRQFNPGMASTQASCRPGRQEPIPCGPGVDCGGRGGEVQPRHRFDPEFAPAFVEIALVADPGADPGLRLRVEGRPDAVPVGPGASSRIAVPFGATLRLLAETCEPAGTCRPTPVTWPSPLCAVREGSDGRAVNPRPECTLRNDTGRTVATAFRAPAWSFDVEAVRAPAGQTRIYGSFAAAGPGGGAAAGPAVAILECPTACGTVVAAPGTVRIASMIMNRPPPAGDLRTRICGAPADDAQALAATAFSAVSDRSGAVHWVCSYTLGAEFAARHFDVRFRP